MWRLDGNGIYGTEHGAFEVPSFIHTRQLLQQTRMAAYGYAFLV